MPLTPKKLKIFDQTFDLVSTINYYADYKDWGKIEKLIDYVDLFYEHEIYLYYLVMTSAPIRTKINNWYVLRDEVVEEFRYRNISPYTIQTIRQIP